MDILEYKEARAAETLTYLRSSYDHLTDRLHNVITALVGGAGAVAALALARFTEGGADAKIEWAGLATLACAWCFVAVLAALKGATSNELSPGNGPAKIGRYHQWWLDNPRQGDSTPADTALAKTRDEELTLQQKRITEYINACTARAEILDLTYRLAALSLLTPLLTIGLLVNGRA